MKSSRFNFKYFVFTLLIFLCLTFITFIAAAAIDEGTGGTGMLIQILGKIFNIMRFPTHTLFFEYMTGRMFVIGLLINAVIYALLFERAIALYKSKFYD